MLFGGYNRSQVQGEMFEFRLADDRWWSIELQSLKYGERYLSRTTSLDDSLKVAIVDTGTSMLTIPKSEFDDLTNKWKMDIQSDDFACFDGLCLGDKPCKDYHNKVSNLTFGVDDKVMSISSKAYLIEGVDLDPDFADTCIFGVLPMP